MASGWAGAFQNVQYLQGDRHTEFLNQQNVGVKSNSPSAGEEQAPWLTLLYSPAADFWAWDRCRGGVGVRI